MLHPLSLAGRCLALLISLIFLMVGGDAGRSASPRSAHGTGPKQDGMYIWVFCSSNALFPASVKHGVVGPSLTSGDSFLPSLCTFYVLNYKVGAMRLRSPLCQSNWHGAVITYWEHPHCLVSLSLSPTHGAVWFLGIWVTFISWSCYSWSFLRSVPVSLWPAGFLTLELMAFYLSVWFPSSKEITLYLMKKTRPSFIFFLANSKKAGLCFAVGPWWA